MGLRTESKVIGEHEYEVRQLDAVKGRECFLRFAKVVAPAIAELGPDVNDKTGVSLEVLGKAFAKAIDALSSEDLKYFCDVFAASTNVVVHDEKCTRRPSLKDLFALHFAGDELPNMFSWLAFCFEVNFGSFFARLGLTRATTGVARTESK